MKIIQSKYSKGSWQHDSEKLELNKPLVLVFGDRFLLEKAENIAMIKKEFPYEDLVFGSTAGEIMGANISEGEIVVTAIEFERSSFKIETSNVCHHDMNSLELGKKLISKLPTEDLKHVFIISEGSFVNGSDLLKGLETDADKDFCITGGLCGDGSRFEKTVAGYNDAREGEVVAIGLYGESLEVSFASFGGWIPFGPERMITRSVKNVLFELDGQPALDLYSNYLGDKASELPEASLFYPLYLTEKDRKHPVVRTILGIDKEKSSMTLAGNVPTGGSVQLMLASADALLEGSLEAAKLAFQKRKKPAELALLVSCIGRKLVLSQRAEEEIEEVISVIGDEVKVGGFYSYGEIAPFYGEKQGSLHNQTMTLTLFSE